ncbi:hypothetical protein RRSWK_06252 [Rhodopirellula sp. SWK7]|nr:hypothetical protein RRSWK_06252 [Rhodopirellula sp. SWK7]
MKQESLVFPVENWWTARGRHAYYGGVPDKAVGELPDFIDGQSPSGASVR